MSEKNFESGIPLQEHRKIKNPEEQKERLEIIEEFKELLGKEPEYNYRDGSLGVSHSEDVVELIWSDEKSGKPEGIKLDQSGEWGSNYAHSQSRNYEADSTAMQISKIIAEKGAPVKIGYTRIDIDNWAGHEDEAINERRGAEFDFSEIETELLKAARALAPEYEKMTIEQIGNALIEKEAQQRHQEVVERFKNILGEKPEYNYRDGSLGVSHSEDVVELIWSDEKSGKPEGIKLDQSGEWGSNYAHSQSRNYEADSTAHQLAKIIAEQGIPKNIIYTRVDINDWPGSEYENKQISGIMNFSEIETELLKAARALAPEYEKMTIEQIGNALIEKETQKE
jgi:uncharacterized protein (UPF0305 family)